LGIKDKIKNSRIIRSQKISEATVIIIIITLISKIIGFIREALIANYFGATAQTDAFDIALIIPSMVFGLIAAGGLQSIIIPVYTEKKKIDKAKAVVLVNQISLITSILLIFLSLLIFAFPELFIKLFAYGFQEDRLLLASKFVRILILLGFFNVFTGFFTGVLQSEKQFLLPAVTAVIGNSLIPLSLILLTKKLGIFSWAIGEIAFALFAFTVLFSFLRFRWGFFKKLDTKNIDWQELRHFGLILLPVIFISGLNFVNQIVDKTIASTLSIGSVAVLHWAQLVYILPVGLISTSLNTAVYPTLSHLAAEKDYQGYTDMFKKTISILAFVMIPIAAIFIVLSAPIVKLLFQRGAFTQQAAELTSISVTCYSLGIFFYSANDLLTRIFYSYKDTKVPLYRSLFTVALNIVGNIILSRFFGAPGIAVSTSIATTTGFFLYTSTLKKKNYIKGLSYRDTAKEIMKVVLASVPVALLSYFTLPYIMSGDGFFITLGRFILIITLSVIVYLMVSLALKLEGIKIISPYIRLVIAKYREN